MGLLLSILVECVGVLEVIACYQHFTYGIQNGAGNKRRDLQEIKHAIREKFASTTVHDAEGCVTCEQDALDLLRQTYQDKFYGAAACCSSDGGKCCAGSSKHCAAVCETKLDSKPIEEGKNDTSQTQTEEDKDSGLDESESESQVIEIISRNVASCMEATSMVDLENLSTEDLYKKLTGRLQEIATEFEERSECINPETYEDLTTEYSTVPTFNQTIDNSLNNDQQHESIFALDPEQESLTEEHVETLVESLKENFPIRRSTAEENLPNTLENITDPIQTSTEYEQSSCLNDSKISFESIQPVESTIDKDLREVQQEINEKITPTDNQSVIVEELLQMAPVLGEFSTEPQVKTEEDMESGDKQDITPHEIKSDEEAPIEIASESTLADLPSSQSELLLQDSVDTLADQSAEISTLHEEHQLSDVVEIQASNLHQENADGNLEDQIEQEVLSEEEETASVNADDHVLVVSNGYHLSNTGTEEISAPQAADNEGYVVNLLLENPAQEDVEEEIQNDVGHVSNDFSSLVFNFMPPGLRQVIGDGENHNEELATEDISDLSMFTETDFTTSDGVVYIVDDGTGPRHIYIDRTTNSVMEFVPELNFEPDNLNLGADDLFYRPPSPYPPDEVSMSRNALHIPESLYETDSNQSDDGNGRNAVRLIEVTGDLGNELEEAAGGESLPNIEPIDDVEVSEPISGSFYRELPQIPSKSVTWADDQLELRTFGLTDDESMEEVDSNVFRIAEGEKKIDIVWDNSSSEEIDKNIYIDESVDISSKPTLESSKGDVDNQEKENASAKRSDGMPTFWNRTITSQSSQSSFEVGSKPNSEDHDTVEINDPPKISDEGEKSNISVKTSESMPLFWNKTITSMSSSEETGSKLGQTKPDTSLDEKDSNLVSSKSEDDDNIRKSVKPEGPLSDFWNKTISSQNSSLDVPLNSSVNVQQTHSVSSGLQKQITLSTNLRGRLLKSDSSVSEHEPSFDEDCLVQSTVSVQQNQWKVQKEEDAKKHDAHPPLQVHKEVDERENTIDAVEVKGIKEKAKQNTLEGMSSLEQFGEKSLDVPLLEKNEPVHQEPPLESSEQGSSSKEYSQIEYEVSSELTPESGLGVDIKKPKIETLSSMEEVKTISSLEVSQEPASFLGVGQVAPIQEIEVSEGVLLEDVIDSEKIQTESAVPAEVDEDDEEDTTAYNQAFLNSLDGIKFSPLTRDDGSWRRKNFKKRRSSSSSSKGSRASRDEELKMLTSLEEIEQGVTYDDMTQKSQSMDSLDQTGSTEVKRRKSRKTKSTGNLTVDKRQKQPQTETIEEENGHGAAAAAAVVVVPKVVDGAEVAVTKDIPSVPAEEVLCEAERLERYEVEQAHASVEARRTLRQLTKVASFEDATDAQHKLLLEKRRVEAEAKEDDKSAAVPAAEPGAVLPGAGVEVARDMEGAVAVTNASGNAFWLIFSGEYTKAMNKDWHGTHFCCWQCDESLTGQRYVLRDDHPYCVACYESVFANACEECSKTIGIDSKDLSYKDKHWHEACFLCTKCRVSLVDKQFGSKVDKIYCGNCYDAQFASRCDGCGEIFRAECNPKCVCIRTIKRQAVNMSTDVLSEQMKHVNITKSNGGNTNGTSTTTTQQTTTIRTSLSGMSKPTSPTAAATPASPKSLGGLRTKTVGEERIKRAKDSGEDIAILSMFGTDSAAESAKFSCCLRDECMLGDPNKVTPGTKKMEYKTRQWHEKCFCCCVCKSAIGTKSFIPREQEIYCAQCYEEKFATRCVKCNKIITSGGVTYKNEPWHRECFTCSNCSTSLAGQRFTSRDDKPYCAECFGELFAKRCTACSKPITGIGGTRFISFEERHWHNDCFVCAACNSSLVGRGFITDDQDIICPECAKQKLM